MLLAIKFNPLIYGLLSPEIINTHTSHYSPDMKNQFAFWQNQTNIWLEGLHNLEILKQYSI